jgi:hypothetical protein
MACEEKYPKADWIKRLSEGSDWVKRSTWLPFCELFIELSPFLDYHYNLGFWIASLQYLCVYENLFCADCWVWMKTVQIFSDRIRDRIRLEGFRSVRIRVQIFNIRYRIRIWIFKSHIYDVDIQSYPIRHSWHYLYLNPNLIRNMKTNMISMISIRIRSVFIPTAEHGGCELLGFAQWREKRIFSRVNKIANDQK